MSSKTIFASSALGFSRSTHKKRFVSAKSVGIRNIGMFSVCKRPWVVNAKDRITLGHPDSNGGGNASQQQSVITITAAHDQESCSEGLRLPCRIGTSRLPDKSAADRFLCKRLLPFRSPVPARNVYFPMPIVRSRHQFAEGY